MSRSPIQVPDELKARIEQFMADYRLKTQYSAVQYLFDYFDRNESQKLTDQRKRKEEQERIESNYVDVGSLKPLFSEKAQELDLNIKEMFMFLLDHYQRSTNIDKETLKIYMDLKKK
ncbi:hypothetical protein [Paenibacillus sp. NAIST15-1]|uniref:hypothetical protein n=1 Tax=Paenibacillus sp. NAIST15-1 TaxID=1605994 RepID=UPI00086C6AA5|nr:hypothetical protein [Paenibacillus sp. NAIST15-1]GAV16097.1 hypothetical protein PBN151_6082 [Paenibacillus sp. NAIST15-1]